MKIRKTDPPKPIRQMYQSHTLNEIIPYLPDEECFFDSRHWVCDTLDGILPFSLTTKIASNGQQFLKVMSLKTPQATKRGCIEVNKGGVFDMSYPASKTRRGRVQGIGGDMCPTITCHPEIMLYEDSWRYRKLTPRECFRLMGVEETDIDKLLATGLSDSRLYALAGNSIVVDVLEAVFSNINFEIDEPNIFAPNPDGTYI